MAKAKKTKTKTKTKPKTKPKAKPKTKPATKTRAADFAPAKFQVRENGSFEIFFDIGDFDGDLEVEDAFAAADLTGNGYDWEAVLAPALQRADAAAFAAIEWRGSEADTFVVAAKDKAPLLALVGVLRKVVKSDASLAAAIALHDPERT